MHITLSMIYNVRLGVGDRGLGGGEGEGGGMQGFPHLEGKTSEAKKLKSACFCREGDVFKQPQYYAKNLSQTHLTLNL